MDRKWLSALPIIAFGIGCAAPEKGSPRARETLLAWPAPPTPTETDGAGVGAERQDSPGDGASEPKPDAITTERPDFTNSSRTVGLKRIQLESGYTFTTGKSGPTRVSSHSFPEALFRVGAVAEWFEVQVGLNGGHVRTSDSADTGYSRGLQDLYLASKFALTRQDGLFPETAATLQMTVPTGSPDLTAGKVLPGLLYL